MLTDVALCSPAVAPETTLIAGVEVAAVEVWAAKFPAAVEVGASVLVGVAPREALERPVAAAPLGLPTAAVGLRIQAVGRGRVVADDDDGCSVVKQNRS